MAKKPTKRVTYAAFFQLTEIAADLAAGRIVEVTDFGVFRPSRRKAREIIDIRSGKRIAVTARKSVHFRPSKALREVL